MSHCRPSNPQWTDGQHCLALPLATLGNSLDMSVVFPKLGIMVRVVSGLPGFPGVIAVCDTPPTATVAGVSESAILPAFP